MKRVIPLWLLLVSATIFAQENPIQVERNQRAAITKVINLSDSSLQDWAPSVITIRQEPHPGQEFAEQKAAVNALRKQKMQRGLKKNGSSRGALPPPPVMLNNFGANDPNAVPNDNHMAISDSGLIVSMVNTNIAVYNDTGSRLYLYSLTGLARQVGVLQNISDPRIIYDPINDRFITIFFAGFLSTTTKIIVGFSKTNNPAGTWNFYALSGNYLNDSTWSDYPVVSISDSDLFMTFNHLRNDSSWKTGFVYSVIWQIDKSKGYAGDTLQFNYWHHIVYGNAPIWNICAVQGGSKPSGPQSYFLSVRPGELANDSVFLHTISDSYGSGNAQFSTQVLTTSPGYGIPPDALQKTGSPLATNDARVLSGFYENNKIQYVQNCVGSNVTAAVYVGEIDNPTSANPAASGQLIESDTVDFGYPSIAYIGTDAFDNRAFITCSYSPTDTFPGTAAFYKDTGGNISAMLVIKQGEASEAVLDTQQRWGDYTGIQRKYNEKNVAWLSGSYVKPTHGYGTWIAKLINSDSSVIAAINQPPLTAAARVYPNPGSNQFKVQFELPENNYTQFSLVDINGKLVKILMEDTFDEGTNVFSFNTQYLADGVYFLRITNHGNLLRTEKIVISR
jgi:hypothetical protein